MKQLTLKGN
ncbi:Protein of unknown function [Bacillus wiedmannii]|nr:Protein of unknown function [Bacillus wiedmannii]